MGNKSGKEGEEEEESGDEKGREEGDEFEEVRGEEYQVGEVERVGESEGTEADQVGNNKTRKLIVGVGQLRHFQIEKWKMAKKCERRRRRWKEKESR